MIKRHLIIIFLHIYFKNKKPNDKTRSYYMSSFFVKLPPPLSKGTMDFFTAFITLRCN